MTLSACTKTPPPKITISENNKIYTSPLEVLKDLRNAQDNFYQLSGRFSMTYETLVDHQFLDNQAKSILTGSSNEALSEWRFESPLLPFPDEDVSWCCVAWGPRKQVFLAIHSGIWNRTDGVCPLEKETLPPKEPWTKVYP